MSKPGDYPYVGAAWLLANCCDDNGDPFLNPIPPDLPAGDNRVRTTGILVSPNVVLTEGAQYRNGRWVAVSFQNPLTNFTDFYDKDSNPNGTVYRGYVYHLPGLDREDPHTFKQYDLAVIILDQPVKGIDQFAPLAPVGALGAEQQAKGAPLTVLSYGPNNNHPATWDFVRRASAWTATKIQETSIHLQGQKKSYFVCDGDQGAPAIDAAGDVTALLYIGPKFCHAHRAADGIRVDTPEARAFLCDVATKPLADVDNANGGLDGVDSPVVVYPKIDSPDVLAQFCDSPAAARATAAGNADKTSAGRSHGHPSRAGHRRAGARLGAARTGQRIGPGR
ncbi:MAG TPA: hypothetical protein VFQ80_12285 [Thermomicrobiales bacterium]|nr:hypothetical protein [Thermomicrobiales bacterium]